MINGIYKRHTRETGCLRSLPGEEDKEFFRALVGSCSQRLFLVLICGRCGAPPPLLPSISVGRAASDPKLTTQAKPAAQNGFYRPDTGGQCNSKFEQPNCLIFTAWRFGPHASWPVDRQALDTHSRGRRFWKKSGLSSDPDIISEGWVSLHRTKQAEASFLATFNTIVRLADPRQGLKQRRRSDVIVEIKFPIRQILRALFASAVFHI